MRTDQEAFRTYWWWCNERQRIYLKKTAGEPWPWTEDKILQTYRFCNLFREQDTETIAFRKLAAPYADHQNLWLFYALARLVNWSPTIAEIMEKTAFPQVWSPKEVCEVMQKRASRGEKVYTGAYMLKGDKAGGDKPTYTVFKVLDPVYEAYWDANRECGETAPGNPLYTSIQTATEWLASFHGWGGFLAYEVVTDLRHTRYLEKAPDIMTWGNVGPGAKRGLNRLGGRPVDKALSQEQALEEMRWLLAESPKYLEPHVSPLEMRDIEHALCETFKYERCREGGKTRSLYKKPTI